MPTIILFSISLLLCIVYTKILVERAKYLPVGVVWYKSLNGIIAVIVGVFIPLGLLAIGIAYYTYFYNAYEEETVKLAQSICIFTPMLFNLIIGEWITWLRHKERDWVGLTLIAVCVGVITFCVYQFIVNS